MKYVIKNKATKQLFAGFDANNTPLWTNDQSKAWSDEWIVKAELQASLLKKRLMKKEN